MARDRLYTGMPIDQWFEIMGISPFEANQIGQGIDYHHEAQCDGTFYQYSWQRKFINRHEIAQSIIKAENALAPLLNFYTYPKYITNERIQYSHSAWPHLPSYLSPDAQWRPVKTKYQHLQALGSLKRTVISANQQWTPEDRDGDDIEDTFVLSVATTITDTSQLALYHSDEHRTILDETWRIRPVEITADGTTATFTGHISQLVIPSLHELPDPASLDAANTSIYVAELDVYKIETDTSDIGTGVWPAYYGQSGATGSIDANSPIDDSELGYWRPIIGGTNILRTSPTYLTVNYLAGYPYDDTGRVQEPFASMVAYLACQYMPAKKCGCERSDQTFNWWRSLPTSGEEGTGRPITISEVDMNPLGQSRGAIYAYNQVKLHALPGGVAI